MNARADRISGPGALLLPSRRFARWPASERYSVAVGLVEAFQRLHGAHREIDRSTMTPGERVAWAVIGKDFKRALMTWRIEASRARTGAGRSPARKGHGWPAFDSGAGSAAKPARQSADAGEVTT